MNKKEIWIKYLVKKMSSHTMHHNDFGKHLLEPFGKNYKQFLRIRKTI